MCLWLVRHVEVYSDFGQVWAENVREGLERNGYQRKNYRQVIRAQVSKQTAHEPMVVGFADDIFILLLRRAGYGVCHATLPLYRDAAAALPFAPC